MAAPSMSRTESPAMASTSGSSTPRSTETNGYLLLTIQHAVVKQEHDEETMVLAQGELRLECISLPIPASVGKQTANPFAPSPSDPIAPTHDFWLVLNVSTFEAPLIPTHIWTPREKSLEGISYAFSSQTLAGAQIVVTLPLPNSTAELEDLDSLEVLLRQYGALGAESTALADIDTPHMGTISSPADDLRGRLVLINEDSGEVVGELDQKLSVVEDEMIQQGSKDKPVILDFGGEVDGYSPQVVVKTVPEDEMDDLILKGAHYISKGILGFGSFTSKKMQTGADLFIRNTKAAEKPVHFSPRTKQSIRATHNASVKTVKVAKTTLGKINDALAVVAEKTYATTIEPAVEFYGGKERRGSGSVERRGSGSAAPPIPPRLSVSGASGSPLSQTQTGPSGPSGGPPAYDQTKPSSPNPGSTLSPASASRPPIPPKPANLAVDTKTSSPNPSNTGQAVMSPASAKSPANSLRSSASSALDSLKTSKRPFLNRLLLAGEVVLTSVEATVNELIQTGTTAASSAAGHKYGPEAGQATALLGGSVRNVVVVYVDVRGVGRKALLQGTAKGFVKARLKSGETVQLQADGTHGPGGVEVVAGEVEQGEKGTIVVGMPVSPAAVMRDDPMKQVGASSAQRPAQGYSTVDKETLEMLDRMR